MTAQPARSMPSARSRGADVLDPLKLLACPVLPGVEGSAPFC